LRVIPGALLKPDRTLDLFQVRDEQRLKRGHALAPSVSRCLEPSTSAIDDLLLTWPTVALGLTRLKPDFEIFSEKVTESIHVKKLTHRQTPWQRGKPCRLPPNHRVSDPRGSNGGTMAGSVRELSPTALSAEEIRLRNQRLRIQQSHDQELRDQEQNHGQTIQRLQEQYKDQQDKMRQAFDVSISQEAEQMEERLHKIRLQAETKVEEEKRAHETEVSKLKTVNQSRIDEYKKQGEARIDQIRREQQATQEALHEQVKKSSRKQQRELAANGVTPKES